MGWILHLGRPSGRLESALTVVIFTNGLSRPLILKGKKLKVGLEQDSHLVS